MKPKLKRLEKQKRFQNLVDLGCIVCREHYQVFSPPEIHHIRAGQGMGQRDDRLTIPLCPVHHRTSSKYSFHLARKFFIETYGTELELLEKVNEFI